MQTLSASRKAILKHSRVPFSTPLAHQQRARRGGAVSCSAAAPNRRAVIEGATASALLLLAGTPAFAEDELDVVVEESEAPAAPAAAPAATPSGGSGRKVRF